MKTFPLIAKAETLELTMKPVNTVALGRNVTFLSG